MANEISSVTSLSASKNGVTATLSVSVTRTLTGSGIHSQQLSIGTSAEQITWPADLNTEGISEIQIKNTDATNYVEFANAEAMTGLKLKLLAGESMKFRPSDTSPDLWAQANTAACVVVVVAVGT